MPLHNEYFYNEDLGKKRMQGVIILLLTDYLHMFFEKFCKKSARFHS